MIQDETLRGLKKRNWINRNTHYIMSEDGAKRFMEGVGLFLWALNKACVKHAQLPQPRPDLLTWLAAENLVQARRDLLGDSEDDPHVQEGHLKRSLPVNQYGHVRGTKSIAIASSFMYGRSETKLLKSRPPETFKGSVTSRKTGKGCCIV